ncbi:MAG: peptidase S10 [Proteobacteria bacterium]|nr:peptidase S10 [Pseudomonadota bacterium]
MKRLLLAAAAVAACIATASYADDAKKTDSASPNFQPTEYKSSGSVTTGGGAIAYDAILGTLVVHPKGWNDAATDKDDDKDKNPSAEAAMSYVAYFKHGGDPSKRPITFLFNGGPGSSTVWLHMGAFGPRRVLTNDDTHTPAAPYTVVNNDESLLDTSDLVFIDMPGTGFGRIGGKDAAKNFYGVDQDIHAFASFIRQFLGKYNRWNSPKYIYGESYGTMRAAGLSLALQNEDIDLNGVILLSDILNWDLLPDDPELNPSIDEPYIVSLPSYAATAWYHHKIPNQPKELRPFLLKVEHFATTDYALALLRGAGLSWAERKAIAAKLHAYTGLPVGYLLKSNLRIEYGAMQKELLGAQDLTTGTLDTRFTGVTLDPLSKTAEYDPQSSAIGSAYIAAYNDYARNTLKYNGVLQFKPDVPVYGSWDYKHQPPGADHPLIQLPNVLPDLAVAMKQNPTMKVMVNGGYFDISTPYYEGWMEMRHLPIPDKLRGNIEFHYYESGHMVYVHLPSLAQLHDNVAAFIRKTSGVQ